MTNNEHANKWYDIMTRLTRIEKSSVSLKRWMLAAHYNLFATEMWMMYIYKDMHETRKASREAEKGGIKHVREF